MFAVPDDWNDVIARLSFFQALPRPLAVLLACDLASLVPQSEPGRRAIDVARRWLLGQLQNDDLRPAFHAAFHVASRWNSGREGTRSFAAACVVEVALAKRDAAVAAALATNALAHDVCGAASFARQRRLAADVMEAARHETVGQLLEAAETDASARAVFWDAMHDAGYAAVPARAE
jgi:hypothetical protein